VNRPRIHVGALLIGAATLLACESTFLPRSAVPTVPSVPVASDCAKMTEPTDEDIKFALGFTGDTFDSSWQRTYRIENMRVKVTWKNSENAVAYLDYLIYSCGYTQADWDYYFSDQTMREVLFRDYQNVNRTASCAEAVDKLALFEFTAQFRNEDYRIRYWAMPKTLGVTRFLMMMLVFPETSRTELDRYSRTLFPPLVSCAQ